MTEFPEALLSGYSLFRSNSFPPQKTSYESLAENGQIFWQADATNPMPGDAIGRIVKGESMTTPTASISAGDLLEGEHVQAVKQKVDEWLATQIKTDLAPLFALKENTDLTGAASGIAFQVFESLGVPFET